MRSILPVLLTLGLVLGGGAPALAEKAAPEGVKADPRVKAVLDGLGYKYTVSPSGTYRLEFETKGERSQVVFINSYTQTYMKLEVREIWSVAHEAKGALPEGVMQRLLEETEVSKLGFWSTAKGEGTTAAVYEVRLPANADRDSFNSALVDVITSADVMEKELTGKNVF